MKILIVRFSSIGDIVLTTPVIRALKKQLPDAEIHFLAKKTYAPVLEHNPYIDKRIYLEHDLGTIIARLKQEQYDVVIDLQKNLRSLRIRLALLRSKYFSFNKLNFKKWLLVRFKIDRLPRIHIVDRYMEAVSPLGVMNDEQGLDYFISAVDEAVLGDLPETHKQGYIAWVIGARHYTKKVPEGKLVSIDLKIKQPIVLLGGKEDFIMGEKLKYSGDAVYNACGKYELNQSVAFVKNADLVITNDTGLMHVAAAFGKRIISVWGNTVPQFGMYPYMRPGDPDFVALEVPDLPCRPCTKIGFDHCPKGHFRCMKRIPEVLFDELSSQRKEA